jgi:hypothetical protein
MRCKSVRVSIKLNSPKSIKERNTVLEKDARVTNDKNPKLKKYTSERLIKLCKFNMNKLS